MMDVTEIAPGVYTATFFPGVNVGLIHSGDLVVAVDAPPLPADAIAWRDYIREQTGSPVRWVVLTGSHPARLTGVGYMDAPVVAGAGTLQALQEDGEDLFQTAVGEWLRYHPDVGPLDVRRFIPHIGVVRRTILYDDVPVLVEAVAGDCAGSVWVRLPEQRVLFTGDTLVVGMHPFLGDAPDTSRWLETLVEIRRIRYPVQHLVPGRGSVCCKEDSRPMSEYIHLVRRRVRSLHKRGDERGSLDDLMDECLAQFPIPKGEEGWVRKQVRAGLERVYHEFQPPEE